MNDLSIRELREASSDLLDKRMASLGRLPTGDYFKNAITEKLSAISALPDSITKLPLSELLRLLDKSHDQWARSIHYLVRAAEECPTMPESTGKTIELIRERYMSGLNETRDPYGVEAQRGRERAEKLPGDQNALTAVATPDGRNLFDWISSYVDAGKSIGGGLSGRADQLASSGDASQAGRLRSELIGLYGELRAAIRLQLKAQSDLPRTLEDDILGNFDELQRLALQRRKKAQAEEEKKPE